MKHLLSSYGLDFIMESNVRYKKELGKDYKNDDPCVCYNKVEKFFIYVPEIDNQGYQTGKFVRVEINRDVLSDLQLTVNDIESKEWEGKFQDYPF